MTGPEGDLELLALAAEALARRRARARSPSTSGDAGIVRALLASTPARRSRRASRTRWRARTTRAHRRSRRSRGARHDCRAAATRSSRARACSRRRPPPPPLARLLALFDAAVARGLGPHLARRPRRGARLRVLHGHDLPRLRRRAPATRSASGGRYDELLARFGCPMPAAGFALDLDRVAEALPRRGRRRDAPPCASSSSAAARTIARGRALRARGRRRRAAPGRARPRSRGRARGASRTCSTAPTLVDVSSASQRRRLESRRSRT